MTVNPNLNGIFQKIFIEGKVEFLTETIAKQLDLDYYYSHSGEKEISRLYSNLLEDVTILDKLKTLAELCSLRFADNWNNIYKAYTTEYKPLENYSMVENEKVKSKVKTSVDTGSAVYGFNSDEAVDDTKVKTETITEGSKDDNDRDLTRYGNIGVTTSQQMLQSEIDLRVYDIYQQMMNDVDKILCTKIY